VTVGVGLTVTVTCAVLLQPDVVPVTVYVVVAAGETVMGDPLMLPGFQLYDVAPPPVSVVDPPTQMVGFDAVAVTVGVGLTVTVTCAVLVHPFAPVPVTVYVVVAAGETVIGEPLIFPGFQLYEVPPPPVNVVDPPEQIVGEGAVAVMVGDGFTVIVTCAVPVHPLVVPVTVYVVVAAGETVIGDPPIAPGFQT